MKTFLVAALLLISCSSAVADTPTIFHRSGDYMAIRPGGCLVTNLTVPAEIIPQGGSTAGELLLSFLPRFMTLDEYLIAADEQGKTDIRIACGLDPAPIVVKLWRVAVSGTNTTRPVYELLDPITNDKKLTKIRVAVGDECENAIPTYSLASSGGREWRYLAGQTVHISLCEYK